MKNVFILVVLFVFAFLSCAEDIGGEGEGGFVNGIIRDSETLEPIDSVEVNLYTQLGHGLSDVDYSNAAGDYSVFSGFSSGNHILTYIKDGYSIDSIDVYIIALDTVTINFKLSKN